MQNYSNLFLKILYYCFRCNVNNVRLFLKTLNTKKQWFQSLSYNTSAMQGRHECDTSDAMRHKCYTNDTSPARVKNFDNYTIKNIFSHPYIYHMANERLQGETQFHFRTCLLQMPHSHVKMRLKSALQKLNFLMAKDISESYTLACSCMLMP